MALESGKPNTDPFLISIKTAYETSDMTDAELISQLLTHTQKRGGSLELVFDDDHFGWFVFTDREGKETHIGD